MSKVTPKQLKALRNFGLDEKYLPHTKANASLLLTYIIEGNRAGGKDKKDRIAIFLRLFDEWVGARVRDQGGKIGTVKGVVARSQMDVRSIREFHQEFKDGTVELCPFKLLVVWDDAPKLGHVTTTVVSLTKKITD